MSIYIHVYMYLFCRPAGLVVVEVVVLVVGRLSCLGVSYVFLFGEIYLNIGVACLLMVASLLKNNCGHIAKMCLGNIILTSSPSPLSGYARDSDSDW